MAVFCWIISLVASAGYGVWLTLRPVSGLRSAAKTLAILALAGVSATSGGPGLLTLALVACALGDFFLSRPSERAFMLGMAAFAIGHVLYILLMYNDFTLETLAERSIGVVALGLLTLGLLTLLWKGLADLRVPVLGYTFIIFLMGATAIGQGAGVGFIYLAAALSFVASDAILALEKFRPDVLGSAQRAANHAVWGLYYLAQVGFTLTIYA